MIKTLSALLLLLMPFLTASSVCAQELLSDAFEFNRPHFDLEIRHPFVSVKSLGIYNSTYILRYVLPIDEHFQVGIEQPMAIQEALFAGNTTFIGTYIPDTSSNLRLSASIVSPDAVSGSENLILGDPWHVYRSTPKVLSIITECSDFWSTQSGWFYGGSGGLQFYKFTGTGDEPDDPAGYVVLSAAAGHKNARRAFTLSYLLLYYTGQTYGISPFVQMASFQIKVSPSEKFKPAIALEVPLSSSVSNSISVIINLKLSFLF